MAARQSFPVFPILLLSAVIGAVYFLPQGLYFLRLRTPHVLLEENFEETSFAVLASRAAREHEGQPNPYRLPGSVEPALSSHSAQPFPPAALGAMARAFGVPVTVVFWAGSFVFPAILALLLASMAWLCGVRDPAQIWLLASLCLLALPPPYWPVQARYVANVLVGREPGFLMMLPYSRRFQPQFTAVFHYLAIAASLLLLRGSTARVRLAAAVISGASFGITFYCYLFSWSILLGWFVLGAACVWVWRRHSLRLWLLACCLGLVISIPYWAFTVRHFDQLAGSAGLGPSHRLDVDLLPELCAVLAVVAALAFSLKQERSRQDLLWAPLVLSLVAALGVVQNVATGLYLQPYHYLHYFARPAVNFAVSALWVVWLERLSISPRQAAVARLVVYAVTAVAITAALPIQLHRYRRASSAAVRVSEALPALEALQRRATVGAIAHSPIAEVREAIPLYTNAVPYFSRYMVAQQTAEKRDAILERIAGACVLQGMSEEDFARLVRSRPWDIYSQYIVRRSEPEAQRQMREIEGRLLAHFRFLLESGNPPAFDRLDYYLLPAAIPLEATRLPRYFRCRNTWSDGRYTLYALVPLR